MKPPYCWDVTSSHLIGIFNAILTRLPGSYSIDINKNEASLVPQMVKNPPAMQIPGFYPSVGKIPQRRAWRPLSILAWRLPMNRGAWLATVHGIAKSQTWLKWLSTQNDSQVYKRSKKPRIANTILKEKNKVGEFMLPSFKFYCKATVIKTVWCWWKKRQMDQWEKLERSEIEPHKYGHLIFVRGAKSV